MIEWILTLLAFVVVPLLALTRFLQKRETRRAARWVDELGDTAEQPQTATVDFSTLTDLPAPVQRYFRKVLKDGQPLIRGARIKQKGDLRTGISTRNWSSFRATHYVLPAGHGFVWWARVKAATLGRIRVLEGLVRGEGRGRVTLYSAYLLGEQDSVPEINEGSLYRYLAESVWFPTALLPQMGVAWTPVNEQAARASLTVKDCTVSLEFRFNDADEVDSVYSPNRPAVLDGRFQERAWEGHFRDYEERAGMWVPLYGRVGWYAGDELEWVWKGKITDTWYQFVETEEPDETAEAKASAGSD